MSSERYVTLKAACLLFLLCGQECIAVHKSVLLATSLVLIHGNRNQQDTDHQVRVNRHGQLIDGSSSMNPLGSFGSEDLNGSSAGAPPALVRQDAFNCTGDEKCGARCPYTGKAPKNKLCVGSNILLCHWNIIGQDIAAITGNATLVGVGNTIAGAVSPEEDAITHGAEIAGGAVDVAGGIAWAGYGGTTMSLVQIVEWGCNSQLKGETRCAAGLTGIMVVMTIVGLALTIADATTTASSLTMFAVGQLMSKYGPIACKLGLKNFAKYIVVHMSEVLHEIGSQCLAAMPAGGTPLQKGMACLGKLAFNFVKKLFGFVYSLLKQLVISILKLLVGIPREIHKNLKSRSPMKDVCCQLQAANQHWQAVADEAQDAAVQAKVEADAAEQDPELQEVM